MEHRYLYWTIIIDAYFLILKKLKLIKQKTTPESIQELRKILRVMANNKVLKWEESSKEYILFKHYNEDIERGFIEADGEIFELTMKIINTRKGKQ